jgi:hypothetical protein
MKKMKSKVQGNLGLVKAIEYFGTKGWTVSIPLNDSQPYDLIVDDGNELYRVSVRTSFVLEKGKADRWSLGVCTKGGNQSFHTVYPFDNKKVDILFALTGDGTRWVIPSSEISAKFGMVLGPKWEQFKIK